MLERLTCSYIAHCNIRAATPTSCQPQCMLRGVVADDSPTMTTLEELQRSTAQLICSHDYYESCTPQIYFVDLPQTVQIKYVEVFGFHMTTFEMFERYEYFCRTQHIHLL
ncbi:hypothetical protein AMECASPLE_036524 [Ameca splendens]|uniref:Uncharacterized protein n=1 Tax=Ameca splendens TaxID=208324 RepID=A0ABV0XWJ2_9TELE